MVEQTSEAPSSAAADEYVVLDPIAYAHALWRRRLRLIFVPVLLAGLLYGLSYTQKKTYQSVVRFMPPKPTGTSLFSIGRTSSGDEYRAELGSRTVGMDVVRRLHLEERLKVKDEDLALRMLQGMAKFTVDINQFITITVTSGDPKLSADIANEFYAALDRLAASLSEHEAEHRLNYMAGPLKVEQQRLQAAEDALEEAQTRTGIVAPTAQASLGLQQVATLRARVSELQATMATSLVGATENNPQVVALRSQINNLQGQIHALEGKNQQVNSPSNLPKLSLEVVRREREVTFHTATLEALTRSLGLAQTTESYTPSLSLIDGAFPAKQKFAPQRKLWALVGLLLGLFFELGSAILWTGLGEWNSSPKGQATLSRWRVSWRRRSQLSDGLHG